MTTALSCQAMRGSQLSCAACDTQHKIIRNTPRYHPAYPITAPTIFRNTAPQPSSETQRTLLMGTSQNKSCGAARKARQGLPGCGAPLNSRRSAALIKGLASALNTLCTARWGTVRSVQADTTGLAYSISRQLQPTVFSTTQKKSVAESVAVLHMLLPAHNRPKATWQAMSRALTYITAHIC
jgi:hypothetical protein